MYKISDCVCPFLTEHDISNSLMKVFRLRFHCFLHHWFLPTIQFLLFTVFYWDCLATKYPWIGETNVAIRGQYVDILLQLVDILLQLVKKKKMVNLVNVVTIMVITTVFLSSRTLPSVTTNIATRLKRNLIKKTSKYCWLSSEQSKKS